MQRNGTIDLVAPILAVSHSVASVPPIHAFTAVASPTRGTPPAVTVAMFGPAGIRAFVAAIFAMLCAVTFFPCSHTFLTILALETDATAVVSITVALIFPLGTIVVPVTFVICSDTFCAVPPTSRAKEI